MTDKVLKLPQHLGALTSEQDRLVESVLSDHGVRGEYIEAVARPRSSAKIDAIIAAIRTALAGTR